MRVSIIAAMDVNYGIGLNGALPWHISEDLQRFRMLTDGHCLIMGRRTFESLPGPLPNRSIIVVSATSRSPNAEKVAWVRNFHDALLLADEHGFHEVFVCGGTRLFAEARQWADRIYLTFVEKDYHCDTFFPFKEFYTEWGITRFTGEPNVTVDKKSGHLVRYYFAEGWYHRFTLDRFSGSFGYLKYLLQTAYGVTSFEIKNGYGDIHITYTGLVEEMTLLSVIGPAIPCGVVATVERKK